MSRRFKDLPVLLFIIPTISTLIVVKATNFCYKPFVNASFHLSPLSVSVVYKVEPFCLLDSCKFYRC